MPGAAGAKLAWLKGGAMESQRIADWVKLQPDNYYLPSGWGVYAHGRDYVGANRQALLFLDRGQPELAAPFRQQLQGEPYLTDSVYGLDRPPSLFVSKSEGQGPGPSRFSWFKPKTQVPTDRLGEVFRRILGV